MPRYQGLTAYSCRKSPDVRGRLRSGGCRVSSHQGCHKVPDCVCCSDPGHRRRGRPGRLSRLCCGKRSRAARKAENAPADPAFLAAAAYVTPNSPSGAAWCAAAVEERMSSACSRNSCNDPIRKSGRLARKLATSFCRSPILPICRPVSVYRLDAAVGSCGAGLTTTSRRRRTASSTNPVPTAIRSLISTVPTRTRSSSALPLAPAPIIFPLPGGCLPRPCSTRRVTAPRQRRAPLGQFHNAKSTRACPCSISNALSPTATLQFGPIAATNRCANWSPASSRTWPP